MLPGAAAMRGVARFLQNVLQARPSLPLYLLCLPGIPSQLLVVHSQDVEESRRRASPSRGGAVGPPLDRSTASWLSVGSVNSLPDSAGPQGNSPSPHSPALMPLFSFSSDSGCRQTRRTTCRSTQ